MAAMLPPQPCTDCGQSCGWSVVARVRCSKCQAAMTAVVQGCRTLNPRAAERVAMYRDRAERGLPLFAGEGRS